MIEPPPVSSVGAQEAQSTTTPRRPRQQHRGFFGATEMSSPPWIEAFCQHYALHGNATAAFIGAHPRAANWKRRSAGRKAVELMKRPDVAHLA
jgi:hypothetical protein